MGPRIPHPAIARDGSTREHRAPHLRCHEANVVRRGCGELRESFHKSEPLDGHRVGIFPSHLVVWGMERSGRLLYLSCSGQEVANPLLSLACPHQALLLRPWMVSWAVV